MAYTDLFGSNVLAYWKFQDNLEPTSGTYDSNTTVASGTYSFNTAFGEMIQDGDADTLPINDNTKSLYRTSGGLEQVVIYNEVNFNTPLQAPFTLEMWVNYNIDNDSTNRPEADMRMYNAAGTLVGGLLFNSGATGWYTGSASNRGATNGTLGLNTGVWNHVAVVYPDTNAKNAKLYVNGTLRMGAAAVTDFFPGLDSVSKITSPRVRAVGSTGGSGDTAAIAVQDAIVTNRALTKYEIAKKARYRFGDTDLNTVIAARNPYLWYKFENIVPGNPTIYNSGSYVGSNPSPESASVSASRTYNVPGIEGGEGIRNTFVNTNNGIGLANTKEGVRKSIWNSSKSGLVGFTIEWWQKTPAHNPTASNPLKTFFIINGANAQSLGGMQINTGTISAGATTMIGVPSVTQVYVSGTTGSYLSGALATNNTERQYINYADGDWHHCLYTFQYCTSSTSGKSQTGTLYIDGEVVRSRAFTNNSNTYGMWSPTPTIDEFVNYVDVYLTGSTSSVADDGRAFTFDNFVFYDYVLTQNQVRENYYAWSVDAYPTPPATGSVRYWNGTAWVTSSAQKVWNGTAWVDWAKSYWNGTSWISI